MSNGAEQLRERVRAGAVQRATETYDQGLALLSVVKHAGRRAGLLHIARNDLHEALFSPQLLPAVARAPAEGVIRRLKDF